MSQGQSRPRVPSHIPQLHTPFMHEIVRFRGSKKWERFRIFWLRALEAETPLQESSQTPYVAGWKVVCSLLHPSLMPVSSLRDCLLLAGTACLVAGLVGCGNSPEKKEAAFLKRGDVYLGQKDYARAMLEYRNAAQLRPGDAEPLYRLGLAYLRVGNPRGSVVALRQALQRNPG